MEQHEINQAVGKKIKELTTTKLGELLMSNIELQAAQAVVLTELNAKNDELNNLKAQEAVIPDGLPQ